jgi:hypothetical protein
MPATLNPERLQLWQLSEQERRSDNIRNGGRRSPRKPRDKK